MSPDNSKKLFLLDAYALIFRAYYAFIRNPRSTSKGLNTSAIFGFVNSLLEILEKEKPTHIAVAFDPSGPTFRHEMYKEYKAQREATPEDIRLAVPYIKQLLEAFNIPVVEVEGYEADDVIGTLSRIASEKGFVTYMVTPDKDYAQLVSDNVFMFKPRSKGGGNEIWGVEEIKEKFAVETPEQVIDILALWGDSADNIPGCPGVGEKRAKELIAAYGSVKGVYENIEKLKGKQKENMVNFREQVEMSNKLVVIERHIPEDFNPDEYVVKEPDIDKVFSIMDELEFRNLKNRVATVFGIGGSPQQEQKSNEPVQGDLFAQPAAAGETADTGLLFQSSSHKSIDSVKHSYYLVNNDMSLDSLKAELSILSDFCFDTETTSVHAMDAELVGISFSWKEGEAYYVPVPANRQEALTLVSGFKSVFEDASIGKTGQNIKYDMLVLKNYDIDVKGELFDTMVAHHLLHPGLKNNMNFMAETYLDYSPVSIESLIGKKGKTQGSMRNVEVEVVKEYAAEDADITLRLSKLFKEQLEKSEVKDLFYNVEMPLVSVLTDMEFEGVTLNVEALNNYADVLKKDIAALEKNIYSVAGKTFNIASPRQVGEVLFDVLKIDDKAKKTKSGQYSTGEDILQRLKSKHEIIPAILEYRGLKKLLNTYVEALPKLINPKTGRIHTSYNQTVVVTGRLSSTNPNLQNIPIRDEAGREIRKVFTPSGDDYLFFSADYSQVELRLMAHFSKDEHLITAFQRGEDIHRATAAKVFKVSLDEVDDDMRRKAKTANFGIIYGISAFGLAERLNIPRKEAKAIIDGYFDNFPGVKEFMDKSIKDARESGFVETLFHRRRYLPDINSRNAIVRGIAERNAINAPIQGTAADIIKMAMVSIQNRFEKEGVKSKMMLQVHDELNFNMLKFEQDIVKQIVKQEMESAVNLSVPLVVDMGVGYNWLEAH